jgi:hypothetical protein
MRLESDFPGDQFDLEINIKAHVTRTRYIIVLDAEVIRLLISSVCFKFYYVENLYLKLK